jgi:hypothetical protein
MSHEMHRMPSRKEESSQICLRIVVFVVDTPTAFRVVNGFATRG